MLSRRHTYSIFFTTLVLLSHRVYSSDWEGREATLPAEINVFSLREPFAQIGTLRKGASITLGQPESESMWRIRFRLSSNEFAEAQCRIADLRIALGDEKHEKAIKPKSVTVAFSPRGDALNLIVEKLEGAQSSVDLAMFSLSNSNLVEALCYLSSRGNVKVRYFADKENLTAARKTVIDRLVAAGVSIYVPSDSFSAKMHLKCAVIDHRTVISGTANWTVDAFDANFEDTVIVESPELAQQYEIFFEEMTKDFAPNTTYVDEQFLPPPVKKFPSIASRPPPGNAGEGTMTDLSAPLSRVFTDVSNINVYFSPRDRGMDEVFTLMKQATQDVTVAMFIISNDDALNNLRDLAQREDAPRCSLLLGGDNLGPSSLKAYEELARVGIPVYYEAAKLLMHLKTCVLDRRYVITGSANWSCQARDENCEDILIFDSPAMAEYYRSFIEEIKNHAQRITPTEMERAYSHDEKDKLLTLDRPYPSSSFTNQAWVKYISNEKYYDVARQLVKNAQQSISLSMYLIPKTKTMPPRLNALLKDLMAAAQRGVFVYVLLECPPYAGNPVEDGHAEIIDQLRQKGVDAHFDSPGTVLHEKIMVVDSSKILAGSHNWSEGSLSGDVQEGGLLLILPQPDLRLDEHIYSHLAIQSNEQEDRIQEIQFHRQLLAMRKSEREAFIGKLPAK